MNSILLFIKTMFLTMIKTVISFVVEALPNPFIKLFEFVKFKVKTETASFAEKLHFMFMLPTLLRK